MFVVCIIDHIHHLLNEFKKYIFVYNSDRRSGTDPEISESGVKIVYHKYLYKNL